MTFKERLIGALIGLGVCIASMPIAIVVTIVLMPFWSWLEGAAAIEAVGHSGPAEWCYLLIYVVVLLLAASVWSKIERRRRKAD